MATCDFVVVRENRVLLESGSLTAAGAFSADVHGSAIYERVEVLTGDDRFNRPTKPIGDPAPRANDARLEAQTIEPMAPKIWRRGHYVADLANQAKFRPGKPGAHPPGSLNGLPSELICRIAVDINRSQWSERRGVWAAVASNGALHLLPCDPARRPTDPRDFPPDTTVMEQEAAEERAAQENAERFEHAVIPRAWTLVLMSLADETE
jgi:hypothetical protein